MQLAYRERGVVDWLHAQERAMARWRDELAAQNGQASERAGRDLDRLEDHRRWLARELAKLVARATGERRS